MKKMIIQLQQKFEDLKKKLEKFDKMPITLTEYEIKRRRKNAMKRKFERINYADTIDPLFVLWMIHVQLEMPNQKILMIVGVRLQIVCYLNHRKRGRKTW